MAIIEISNSYKKPTTTYDSSLLLVVVTAALIFCQRRLLHLQRHRLIGESLKQSFHCAFNAVDPTEHVARHSCAGLLRERSGITSSSVRCCNFCPNLVHIIWRSPPYRGAARVLTIM